MKKIATLLFFLFLLSLTNSVSAQKQSKMEFAPIGVETFDNADAACCNALDNFSFVHSLDSLGWVRLNNAGSKPIDAYVAIANAGGEQTINITIYPGKPIQPAQIFSLVYVTDPRQAFDLSFDYVRFSDGSAVGADRYGKSKLIDAYFAGRDRAIGRMNEIAGEQAAPGVSLVVDSLRLMTFADLPDTPDDEQLKAISDRAYKQVIDALKQNTSKHIRDIADKMAAM